MDCPCGCHHVDDCVESDTVDEIDGAGGKDACGCWQQGNHHGDVDACECHSHEQGGNCLGFAGDGESGFGLVHDHEVVG